MAPKVVPLRKSKLLFCGDINTLADPDYLIDGFLPNAGIYPFYGRPGAKKGFVVLDAIMTIGALTADEVRRGIKMQWHGRDVEHGAVLYVWAEGQSGIKKRITAWRQMRQRMNVGHSVAVYQHAINLRDPESVDELISLAHEAAEGLGLPLKAIVLDTLSKCSGGGDINSPGPMSEVVAGMERVRDATGAVIIPIHHDGKDATKGMMGSTVFLGAVDAEFKVSSEGTIITVEGGKTKDDAPASLVFQTRIVDVLDPISREPMLTRNGKPVTTLTIEPSGASGASGAKAVKLTARQSNAYQAFLDWLNERETNVMPLDEWWPLMKSRGVTDDRNRAKECRDQLDARGLLRIENEQIYPGRKTINFP
jgi:hypothetical protein